MFDFIKTHQQVIGKHRLIEIAFSHFPQIKESEIEQLIQELCNENKIQIFNPGAKPEAQLVCLVPKAS
jgi:predicted CopG family antitoxin